MMDIKLLQQRGPTFATLEPQYPPGKKLAVRPKDLAAFCFPEGVKDSILRALIIRNELVVQASKVLAFFARILLEKQVVLVCPNLVLLERMLDFLDVPVPFIVGVQNKLADRKIKASNLVHVNVVKDQVIARYTPALPRYKELVYELRPIHARMYSENCTAQRHPVHKCSEVQAEAAS